MPDFRPNVLLTSAGRRNYLVADFRAALAGRGLVLAADANAEAAALQEADRALVVPPLAHPSYTETLLALCVREDVGLVVPLNDLDLPVLAAAREHFLAQRVFPLVSRPEIVEACFDKLLTASTLTGIGIAAPLTFTSLESALNAIGDGRLRLPAFVKPRWGSGSLGVHRCCDPGELALAFRLLDLQLRRSAFARAGEANVIVQPELRGTEYGLDVVNDLAGRHVAVAVKEKLAMRAGETERARTADVAALREVGAAIGRALAHVGNLDCDVFLAPGEAPVVLELNPRFGGGYPFSRLAGLDLPGAILAWLRGEEASPALLSVRAGVGGAKCDRLVVLR